MRAASRGDSASYRTLLSELAEALRGVVAGGFARAGLGSGDVEDVVQETLLALHLKRHTWDESQPFVPWVNAIARNKLIDNLRRRGRRVHIPIDEIGDMIAQPAATGDTIDAERALAILSGRQRDIVMAISIKGATARDVARDLGMTEGAVRVALHRALQALAKTFRTDTQ